VWSDIERLINSSKGENMEKRGLFLMPISSYGYRREGSGNPLITGLCMVTPDGRTPRVCYEVTFADGFVDHVAVSDVDSGAYALVDDTWMGLSKSNG
jgi:hypothetical protein